MKTWIGEAVAPLGFVAMPKSRERTRSVLACFGTAAGSCMFQLWALGGNRSIDLPAHPTQSRGASGHFPRTCPGGRAICGRPAFGTSLDSCHLLQDTSGEECSSDACVESDQGNRKLRLELRRAESGSSGALRSPCHHCLHLEAELDVRGMRCWSL